MTLLAKGTVRTLFRQTNGLTGDEKHVFLHGLWDYFQNKYVYFLKTLEIAGGFKYQSPPKRISDQQAQELRGIL